MLQNTVTIKKILHVSKVDKDHIMYINRLQNEEYTTPLQDIIGLRFQRLTPCFEIFTLFLHTMLIIYGHIFDLNSSSIA